MLNKGNELSSREFMVLSNLIDDEISVLKKGNDGTLNTSIRTLQNMRNKLYRNSEQYRIDSKSQVDNIRELYKRIYEV